MSDDGKVFNRLFGPSEPPSVARSASEPVGIQAWTGGKVMNTLPYLQVFIRPSYVYGKGFKVLRLPPVDDTLHVQLPSGLYVWISLEELAK